MWMARERHCSRAAMITTDRDSDLYCRQQDHQPHHSHGQYTRRGNGGRTSDGAWQLYLGSQTVRRLYLVLAGQGIPAPDGYYSSNIEAYSQCFDENTIQVSLLSM